MNKYENALSVYRAAASKYHAVCVEYRHRKVGDNVFAAAVAEYKFAELSMDAAEAVAVKEGSL